MLVSKASKTSSPKSDSAPSGDPNIAELRQQNLLLLDRNRYLTEQLELLKRHIFGHKSEKLPASLNPSGSMDLFGQPVSADASTATVAIASHERTVRPKGHGRAVLPENLPCEEIILDVPPEEKICPCCGKDRICIGEDSREELDLVPPQFTKRRYLRRKYACRDCTECGVAQAQPVVSVIDKGIPSARLVVWIVMAKYLDHLPLYRVAAQFKRWGVEISDTTMIGWITSVFELLGPIHRALEHEIRTCGCVHADETTLRVQRGEKDKLGSGKASTDYLWAMLGRSPDGTPIGVSFHYANGRGHAVAEALLSGVTGVVVSDGYAAYDKPCDESKGIIHAACWAHARRKFHEARQCGYTDADKPLEMIRKLYKAHGRIEEMTGALQKRAVRTGRAISQAQIDSIRLDRRNKWMKPLVQDLKTCNDQMRMSALPKGKFGEAIGYFHNQHSKLVQFLSHARVDLDNNIVERSIRPIAIGRKNWLFAGSEDGAERAALLMSLVGTCRMLEIDPAEYFADVLLRVRIRAKSADFADLTPAQWKAARAT
jgi:transposase